MSILARCCWWVLIAFALLGASARVALAGPELVLDAATGSVLHARDAHAPWFPASLTKLMTLYLTFDAVANATLPLDEPLTISAHAASQPPVGLGLTAGATITAEEAIIAAAVASANDAAVVLAERLAGSEQAFAALMSAQARALGLSGTVFVNATGLPAPGQRTSARDMALLGMRLLRDHRQYLHYLALTAGAYRGARYSTVNGVLGAIEGANGMKTGFTCDAGYNIVASATRDGRQLIAVVLGAGSSAQRNQRAVQLLRQANGAPPDAAPQLSALSPPASAFRASPRPTLDRDSCTRSATRTAIGPGKLPGHGLLIGVFASEAEARRAARRTLDALRGVTRGARAVYLARQFERGRSYKTLLVGLDRESTGKACLALRAKQLGCHPQTHEQINHPQYAYR